MPREIGEFLCVLCDFDRLALLAALRDDERTLDELVSTTSLPRDRAFRLLYALRQIGLVSLDIRLGESFYSYARQPIFDVLRQLSDAEKPELPADASDFDRKTLNEFVKNGRLTAIPVPRKKKDVVLRWLAEKFDAERVYPEREVNAIIREIHEDWATLRREMVDAKLMTRENGVYKRARAGRLI